MSIAHSATRPSPSTTDTLIVQRVGDARLVRLLPPRAAVVWLVAPLVAIAAMCVSSTVAAASGPDALYVAWSAEARANGDEVTDRRYIEHVARLTWPEAMLPWVMATARCETGGTYSAAAYSAAGPYHGAMQVWAAHFGPGQDPWDPLTNMAMGYQVYLRQGPIAWPVCGMRVLHLMP